MLTNEELHNLYKQLGWSEIVQGMINHIRESPPARRVRSSARNVSVRYPSQKMGRIIQAESHRNELAGVYEMEYDENVLEYYDQPPPIKLTYPSKADRTVGVLHTADYFVIRQASAGWEEWKTEEELTKLVERMPHRYIRDAEQGWRCPPGERYAVPFGLYYRVRSSAEIDWVYQRNLLFLEDYLREDKRIIDPEKQEAVCKMVVESPGILLSELLTAGAEACPDLVYTLLAVGELYVDLHNAALAEPDRTPCYRNRETAQAYAITAFPAASEHQQTPASQSGTWIIWDGRVWQLVNEGEHIVSLLAENGAVVELRQSVFHDLIRQGQLRVEHRTDSAKRTQVVRERLAKASPEALREANRRYTIIVPKLSGQSVPSDVPARTVRQWHLQWRRAAATYGCGYIGLLPRYHASGNRTHRLPQQTIALMEKFIADDYETFKQKPKYAVYALFVKQCDAEGTIAPSYKTFVKSVNKRPQFEQIRKREGYRAAGKVEPFHWQLTQSTPRHGDRPFEITHVDHTQLDVELRCAKTDQNLGRPWATMLSDAYSRRILAVTLSFDPPSYRACMMILRVCVQRHQRLPQTIVVDGGSEFESVYFETLLARYECTKKTRPPSRPRFGSVCERIFGTTNSRFIHNLAGNTQISQNRGVVNRTTDPKRSALWTLSSLYDKLCEWSYEVYDTLEHPSLGQTPRATFLAGQAQSGFRPSRHIHFDEEFRINTLPTTRRGTAKVQPSLGIKIHYIYYWSDAFRDPEVEKTSVPIRYDPFDVGVAYAHVKGRWVRCISTHYATFAGRSEREIRFATAELRRRYSRHAQQFALTTRQLADFLTSLEAEELLLQQRLQDSALKTIQGQSALAPDGADCCQEPSPDVQWAKGEVAPDGAPAAAATASLVHYEDY